MSTRHCLFGDLKVQQHRINYLSVFPPLLSTPFGFPFAWMHIGRILGTRKQTVMVWVTGPCGGVGCADSPVGSISRLTLPWFQGGSVCVSLCVRSAIPWVEIYLFWHQKQIFGPVGFLLWPVATLLLWNVSLSRCRLEMDPRRTTATTAATTGTPGIPNEYTESSGETERMEINYV